MANGRRWFAAAVTSEGGTICIDKAARTAGDVLPTGDIIQVVADRKNVSFIYSHPNYAPLSSAADERIVEAVEPFEYAGVLSVLGFGDEARLQSRSESINEAVSTVSNWKGGAMNSNKQPRPVEQGGSRSMNDVHELHRRLRIAEQRRQSAVVALAAIHKEGQLGGVSNRQPGSRAG